MYISVKYGSNETLLCNPTCASVNLLDSIKKRVGLLRSDILVDLSDESGLIKELDLHRHDYASKYLTSHSTYILVEKQVMMDDGEDDSASIGPPQITYTPLLEGWQELFPNYQLRVTQVQKKRKGRGSSKSPSPAGKMSTTNKKGRDRSRSKQKK